MDIRNALIQSADQMYIPELTVSMKVELIAENFLGGGTRTYSPHSEHISGLSSYYLDPTSADIPYRMPVYVLEAADLRTFSYKGKSVKRENFFVHPNNLQKESLINRDRLKSAHREVGFIPTSSHRTVVILDEGKMRRIKLHLEKVRISRYYRNLGGRTIEHSVAVSCDLEKNWGKISASLPMPSGFYSDFKGVVLRNREGGRDGEWGYLERSLYPVGLSRMDKYSAIPLFAFYGAPSVPLLKEPLLVALIKNKKTNPLRFVIDNIIRPVIALWAGIMIHTGLIWEPHGQNVVFLVDWESLDIKAIAFRDADTCLSLTKRNELGLSSEPFYSANVLSREGSLEYPQGDVCEISRVIDVSMGYNTFEFLGKLLEEYFQCSREEFRRFSLQAFKDYYPDYKDIFPGDGKVYGYARNPMSGKPNSYPLEVRSGWIPSWRPIF